MSEKENKTKVWVSLEDLTNKGVPSDTHNEFNHTEESDQSEASRRDFLKYMGFGLGAATMASCEVPVKKAIPYVIKPQEIVPGVATYFATSIVKNGDCTPAFVKTREGRPILVEGNPGNDEDKTFTEGGSCVRSQASVLSLYDTERLKYPASIEKGNVQKMSWEDLDKAVQKGLSKSKNIRILSHTNNSPSFLKAIDAFKEMYPSTQFLQYDSISYSAILEANQKMFNIPRIPSYKFEKAKCIVGIDADFLGTWVSPTEYSNGYVANRKVFDKDIKNAQKAMSIHIQFESRMSLTGSNADHRVLIKPSEMGMAVAQLYKEVCKLTNNAVEGSVQEATFSWGKAAKSIKDTAKKLVANKSNALVVCGVNDVNIQMIVNKINELTGAYNSTLVLDKHEHSNQRMGLDASIEALVDDMNAGKVDALIICSGANPAYDIPGMAAKFSAGLAKVDLSISLEIAVDETSSLCNFIAPDRHNLEAWGDVEPKKGEFYLIQPTIAPLFDSRDAGESLLTWAGTSSVNYYDFVKENWKNTLFTQQKKYMTFHSFWNNSLHDGWFKMHSHSSSSDDQGLVLENMEEGSANYSISSAIANLPKPASKDVEVMFYESIQMGDGQDANNPWLQEFPDPIMRTTWDNFIQIPILWKGGSDYETLEDLKDGDYATVTIDEIKYTLPVFRTFGQMEGTISIALGYGRTKAGKCGTGVGVNLFPAVKSFNYSSSGVTLAADGTHDNLFACLQQFHTYGLTATEESSGERIMHEYATGESKPLNVDEYIDSFQGALVERSVFFQSNADKLDHNIDVLKSKREGYQYLNSKGLYPDYKDVYGMGHHWGMAIDLNSCTGCGACVIACHAENNVPVVGKYEVSKAHDMSWLRIDRYFYGDQETPHAVYMPMMCQHCDNAPCENVCPVAATNHSSEGLNQMTYNRCVGTRYCANNCPYKVRRFNWLDYTSADIFPSNEVDLNRGLDKEEAYYMTDNLTRMVLNPDVTVRSRGVIEKCSFCVQKIQEGKLAAKMEGRKLKDDDVNCACATACSTGAIAFGDMNDPESQVSKMQAMKRAYIPLEETNVRSSVSYLMKVTNRDESFGV